MTLINDTGQNNNPPLKNNQQNDAQINDTPQHNDISRSYALDDNKTWVVLT